MINKISEIVQAIVKRNFPRTMCVYDRDTNTFTLIKSFES